MSARRARERPSAGKPDGGPREIKYLKESWGEQIVQVLREAARKGIRAGLTEADILLAIANNDNARKEIRKGQTPGMLKTVRDHLTTNKFGVFEKCGELAPDLKPKQALWTLKKNADTKNIPDATVGPFQDYAAVWLEKWMLSNASARFLEDPPVAKKPVRVEDDDDDDDEGVAPADVEMATEGAPSPPRVREEPADEDMVDDGDAPPTRGEKRARGDDDTGDAKKTMRVLLAKKGTEEAADGAFGGGAWQKVESAQARREREAAEAAKAAAKAAAEKAAAVEAAAKAAEAAAAKAAEEAVAKAAEEAAAKAAADAAAKAADEAAAKAADEAAAAAAAERRSVAEAEERRLKTAKEAKDARVREAQEKLRTLKREKDERHAAGDLGPSGGSSAAAAGVASSSSSALEARRLWEADAAWWSKHGPKEVDPDSGRRRLFTKASDDNRWHFAPVETSFPNGFVYVADDRTIDEARRRRLLGMPADGAHLLAKKINADTAIFLCRVSEDRDGREKGRGAGASRPRIDLDVYAAAELYPHAEKGAPVVTADASAFGGRLPAQIKLKKRRCFGVSLRDDLGSCAVSGGLVDLRGLSFKTEKKLRNAEILMPVLLKNATRTNALVAELRARAREAIRAKRGLP
jgi:hypothetical protein